MGSLGQRTVLSDQAFELQPLGLAAKGFRGRIRAVQTHQPGRHALPAEELERRLLEIGFIEGAEVEVLHHGPFGRDPVAVKVDGTTFALRRREANAILVEALD